MAPSGARCQFDARPGPPGALAVGDGCPATHVARWLQANRESLGSPWSPNMACDGPTPEAFRNHILARTRILTKRPY